MIRMITILGFFLEGVFALTLVVWSRLNSASLATFGSLLDQVMRRRAARVTLVVFWWWLAWHFLVVPPGV